MNNRYHENGALRTPLIFTVPAYGFVTALYLDWLRPTKSDSSSHAASSARTRLRPNREGHKDWEGRGQEIFTRIQPRVPLRFTLG
jgi:hypothetical protein